MSTTRSKEQLCASTKTKSGKPCRWTRPCPYHARGKPGKLPSGQGTKKNRSVVRHEKLLQGVLAGKSVREAGLDAGYSKSTCEGKIYQIMDSPKIKECIRERVEAAKLETDEIIGALVQYMRFDLADLFPADPLLRRAKQLGISRNIRKVKRRPVIAGYDKDENPILEYELEVEAYNGLDAAKHLTTVFGLQHLPAPKRTAARDFQAEVERIMQKARERGVSMPDDVLRAKIEERLRPAYPLLHNSDND